MNKFLNKNLVKLAAAGIVFSVAASSVASAHEVKVGGKVQVAGQSISKGSSLMGSGTDTSANSDSFGFGSHGTSSKSKLNTGFAELDVAAHFNEGTHAKLGYDVVNSKLTEANLNVCFMDGVEALVGLQQYKSMAANMESLDNGLSEFKLFSNGTPVASSFKGQGKYDHRAVAGLTLKLSHDMLPGSSLELAAVNTGGNNNESVSNVQNKWGFLVGFQQEYKAHDLALMLQLQYASYKGSQLGQVSSATNATSFVQDRSLSTVDVPKRVKAFNVGFHVAYDVFSAKMDYTSHTCDCYQNTQYSFLTELQYNFVETKELGGMSLLLNHGMGKASYDVIGKENLYGVGLKWSTPVTGLTFKANHSWHNKSGVSASTLDIKNYQRTDVALLAEF